MALCYSKFSHAYSGMFWFTAKLSLAECPSQTEFEFSWANKLLIEISLCAFNILTKADIPLYSKLGSELPKERAEVTDHLDTKSIFS